MPTCLLRLSHLALPGTRPQLHPGQDQNRQGENQNREGGPRDRLAEPDHPGPLPEGDDAGALHEQAGDRQGRRGRHLGAPPGRHKWHIWQERQAEGGAQGGVHRGGGAGEG